MILTIRTWTSFEYPKGWTPNGNIRYKIPQYKNTLILFLYVVPIVWLREKLYDR